MNHFYKYETIPGTKLFADFDKTNQYDELSKRVVACFLQENKWPNFIAVDNVGSGNGGERSIVIAINDGSIKHKLPVGGTPLPDIKSIINYPTIAVGCSVIIAGVCFLTYCCCHHPMQLPHQHPE